MVMQADGVREIGMLPETGREFHYFVLPYVFSHSWPVAVA